MEVFQQEKDFGVKIGNWFLSSLNKLHTVVHTYIHLG